MSQNLALSQAERRVLILCDVQRTRESVEKMLGDVAVSTVDVLIAQGYLQASPPTSHDVNAYHRTPLANLSRISKKLLREKTSTSTSTSNNDHRLAPSKQTIVAPKQTATPAQRESRRSLAACKMYMLDMLQLQRCMESSALAVDIQTASDEEHLADQLIQALRHLSSLTKASMGQRMAERLQETLPEAQLPKLHSAISELFDTATNPSISLNVAAIRRDVA